MRLIDGISARLPRRFGAFFGTAAVTYLGMGLSLISAPILARSLGADGRGVLAGSFVSIQLLSWVMFLGLPRGLAIQSFKRHRMSRSGLTVVAILGPISAVIAFISAGAVSSGDSRIELGIKLGAVVLVFAGLSQLGSETAVLSGQIWRFNLVRVANVVLPPLALIVAVLAGQLTLPVAFCITLGGQVLATLLGCFFAIQTRHSVARERAPWGFSLRVWSSTAFDSVGGRVDQLLLTALTNAASVGVYAVAITCAMASGGLTQAMNHVTYSRFAVSSAADASTSLKRRSRHGMILSLGSGALVVTAVWLVGPHLFGPGFHDLVPVTAVLVLVQMFNDQWQLRVYFDSAAERGTTLALSSAIALGILGAETTFLAVAGLLTPVTMAGAVLGFAIARLLARAALSRTRTKRL